jgi:hypothetical protein
MKAIVILAVLIGLGLLVVFYSEKSTVYECSGRYNSGGYGWPSSQSQESLYLELVQYRWWVGLWSDGVWGHALAELDDGHLQYYPSVKDVGGDLEFIVPNKFGGKYSTRSRKLSIDTVRGFFVGDCSLDY